MLCFYNLTTGLENANIADFPRIVRIQSSHIERKAWNRIFEQLNDELLFYLAIGQECQIIEGVKKPTSSKVVNTAIPVINYILYRVWFKKNIRVLRMDPKYLDRIYKELTPSVKKKLKYFRKFLLTSEIKLYGITSPAYHDGNYDWYKEKARVELCAWLAVVPKIW